MEKNKKNKLKNPLEGIPTKSLLITLFALLLTFCIGFGTGYGCSAYAESRGSSTVTAYALETSQVLSDSLYVASGLDSYTVPYSYKPVYPAYRSLNGLALDNLSPVGSSFKFTGTESDDAHLSQLFVLGGRVFLLSFPTYLDDTGSVPPYAYNRNYSLVSYSLRGSSVLQQDWSIVYQLHRSGTFNPTFGTSFITGTSQNPIECAISTGILTNTNASIKTSSALTSAVSDFGNPSYVLPLWSFASTRNSAYNTVRPPSTNVSYNGLRLTFVSRYYFGAFNGLSLPDYFADLMTVIYTNELNSADSYNLNLFGIQYEGLLSYVPDSALDSAWQSGYSAGISAGYESGLNAGRAEKLEDITPWQHIVNGVNAFMNLQILPGVRISIILSITFGLILVGFLLKFYLGG